MKEKGNQYRLSVIRAAKQKYRCYHGCRFLQPLTKILPEQMRFCAVQLKRHGNDDWKRIERCITFELFVCINIFLACTPFIGVQIGRLHQYLQSVIEFSPCYTEELTSSFSVMAMSPFPFLTTCILLPQSKILR